MSNPYGLHGIPKGTRALAGLPRPKKGGSTDKPAGIGTGTNGVGSIAYAKLPPDNTYIPANGAALARTAYPEYTDFVDYPPMFTAPVSFAGATFDVQTAETFNGQNGMSDNGEWVTLSNPSTMRTYRVENNVLVQRGTALSVNMGNTLTSNTGNVAGISTASPYLRVYKRVSPTATVVLCLLTGVIPSGSIYGACWAADGETIVFHQSSRVYIGKVELIPGTSNWRCVVTASILLGGTVAEITRNAQGDRWFFRQLTSPYPVTLCKYENGTFTVTQTITERFRGLSSFSPDGKYLAAAMSIFDAETNPIWVWELDDAGIYQVISKVYQDASAASVFICSNGAYILSYQSTTEAIRIMKYGAGGGVTVFSGKLASNLVSDAMNGIGVSRDGTTIFFASQFAQNYAMLKLGAPPEMVHLPYVPPVKSGSETLKAFIKVKA